MKTTESLSTLDTKARYVGYLWLSDETTPIIIENGKIEISLFEQVNPFVIEGQLFDPEGNKSYSIRYSDGQYFITLFDAEDLKHCGDDVTEYMSLRMGNRKLCFKRLWLPQPDALCENMEVLEPSAMIFVGFEPNKFN